MKKANILLLIFLIIFGCTHNDREGHIAKLINDLTSNPEYKQDLIIREFHIIQDAKVLENNTNNDIPVVLEEYVGRDFFKDLADQSLISSNDIDYMYSQVSNPLDSALNSTKLKIPTISLQEIIEINRQKIKSGTNLFETKPQFTYIRFSNPIFSKDFKKAIIISSLSKNSTMNRYLLLEFENNNWIIKKVLLEHEVFKI